MPYRAGHIAQRLGVAVTTVRAWSNEFIDYLSPSAGKQASQTGQRRYDDGDLATLAHAKRLLDDGATYDEARAALAQMTPEQRTTYPVDDAPATAIIPTEAAPLVVSDAYRAALAAKDETISELRARVADLQADKERLQHELDDLRTQARPALLAPTEPPPVSRPWWKFW